MTTYKRKEIGAMKYVLAAIFGALFGLALEKANAFRWMDKTNE